MALRTQVKRTGAYGLTSIKSRRKAMAGTDTFCRSRHGFAAGKDLWLLQTYNDLQKADYWQLTYEIPGKKRGNK